MPEKSSWKNKIDPAFDIIIKSALVMLSDSGSNS
jgi:hypothetical protein